MKMTIDDFEIDIKVKGKWSKKANKQDLIYFLNTMSLFAFEASEYNRMIGNNSITNESNKYHQEMYDILDKMGAFDRCKNVT